MKKLQKTVKVPGLHYIYERIGPSPHRARRFGGRRFQLLEYKNKPRVALFDDWDCRRFRTNQVISPSEARELIGWLAQYIALSDPDPISLAIASTKAHAQLIRHEQNKIAKELGLGGLG